MGIIRLRPISHGGRNISPVIPGGDQRRFTIATILLLLLLAKSGCHDPGTPDFIENYVKKEDCMKFFIVLAFAFFSSIFFQKKLIEEYRPSIEDFKSQVEVQGELNFQSKKMDMCL